MGSLFGDHGFSGEYAEVSEVDEWFGADASLSDGCVLFFVAIEW